MRTKRCELCAFYEPLYTGSETGSCHRYAPRPMVQIDDNANWDFPAVEKTEWCGEFEERVDEED